jgi:hypothetical protein
LGEAIGREGRLRLRSIARSYLRIPLTRRNVVAVNWHSPWVTAPVRRLEGVKGKSRNLELWSIAVQHAQRWKTLWGLLERQLRPKEFFEAINQPQTPEVRQLWTLLLQAHFASIPFAKWWPARPIVVPATSEAEVLTTSNIMGVPG